MSCYRNIVFFTALLSALAVSPLAYATSTTKAVASKDAYSVCNDGLQDKTACRREVATTQKKPPKDPVKADESLYHKNALKRCDVFKNSPADLSACQARVLGGDGAYIEGNVMHGGVLRKDIQTLPPVYPNSN